MKKVLLVRAGSAPAPVVRAHGDFTDWFAAGLGPGVEVAVADAPAGELPDPGTFGGALVTGSLASANDPDPWIGRLGAWMVRAGERRPVLGVCFGHQLLAKALGGEVERHGAGPEAGTVEVALTPEGRADPLLAGLTDRVAVQQMHEDRVACLPPGAVRLAGNAHSPVQAFAHGPRLRGVQFHPEFDLPRTRAMADAERRWLERGRAGLHAEVVAGLRETREAAALVRRWVEVFVEG